jgi:hypothetical protein
VIVGRQVVMEARLRTVLKVALYGSADRSDREKA